MISDIAKTICNITSASRTMIINRENHEGGCVITFDPLSYRELMVLSRYASII